MGAKDGSGFPAGHIDTVEREPGVVRDEVADAFDDWLGRQIQHHDIDPVEADIELIRDAFYAGFYKGRHPRGVEYRQPEGAMRRDPRDPR